VKHVLIGMGGEKVGEKINIIEDMDKGFKINETWTGEGDPRKKKDDELTEEKVEKEVDENNDRRKKNNGD